VVHGVAGLAWAYRLRPQCGGRIASSDKALGVIVVVRADHWGVDSVKA
jgi:hypothetical protein